MTPGSLRRVAVIPRVLEFESRFEIDLDPGPEAVRDPIENAERGCFVSKSHETHPPAFMAVNGKEIA